MVPVAIRYQYMGSSPSSNVNRSNVTIPASAVDVTPNDVQDVRPSPHVRRSNVPFNNTHLGSPENMGDGASLDGTRLTDSQQRMVRICLGELETDLEISLDCDKLMDCVKVCIICQHLTVWSA